MGSEVQARVRAQAEAAKCASRALACLSSAAKDAALRAMADALTAHTEAIRKANASDLKAARAAGARPAYLDRLALDATRIESMADGLREASRLPDPVAGGDYETVRPNGLEIRRVRVPLGVVAIIYEARPNVTSDAAGLCLKSGNAVILRGGSDALGSNRVIASVLAHAAYAAGVPEGAIQLIETRDRAAVDAMLGLRGMIDVVIPRGGAGLIAHIVAHSRVPVIETGTGVCHTFVDETADEGMATAIAVNAKASRCSVCNAMETLLVHANIAASFLPKVTAEMERAGVTLRGCERARAICPSMEAATEEDWATEYGDLILSVRVVDTMDDAIAHIHRYGTGHSEAIVTRDLERAHRFQREVDAAAVYVNASTRFTDGHEFGFGAEIGISTQKLHARGPMGLAALTSTKYLIYGEGQIRA